LKNKETGDRKQRDNEESHKKEAVVYSKSQKLLLKMESILNNKLKSGIYFETSSGIWS
jgi:hypothetical protein